MAACALTNVAKRAQGEPSRADYEFGTRAKLPPGLLMMHTTRSVETLPTATHGTDVHLVDRANELDRNIPTRISTTVLEMSPPLPQACTHQPTISLATWFNMQLQDRQTTTTRNTTTDSYVINVDDELSPEIVSNEGINGEHHDYHNTTMTDNYLNNIREATTAGSANNNNNNNNNNNSEEDTSVTQPLSSETRDLLCSVFDVLNKCLPFAIILLSKFIYDYKSSIVEFLGLLVAFMSANRDLKREIAKQQNRSWKILLSILAYICGCFIVIDYIFEEPLLRMFTVPKTMSELLWSVIITDMVLKLVTVALKVFVTCLPGRILPYQKRGKYYLVMEACSQFYRSTATVYPWFFYLWDCYGGSEAFIAHLFAVAYTNNKFSDVIPRGKLLWSSLKRMWQNMSLGISPSKDQLLASGSICVICHEEYSNPVLLQCNHIFCETCVTTWLDRESTCPLCRAPISDDPIYRDGHTTDFIQWY